MGNADTVLVDSEATNARNRAGYKSAGEHSDEAIKELLVGGPDVGGLSINSEQASPLGIKGVLERNGYVVTMPKEYEDSEDDEYEGTAKDGSLVLY
jgi:hypothetical protein